VIVAPGGWLGLLGGGQLGRMFCMAAQSLGYKVAVLDPGGDSPAGSVADLHLRADYVDEGALGELARRCGAVTTEFENVPAQALAFLASHTQVAPAAQSVAIAQDRIREKTFLAEHGFAVAPFAVLVDAESGDAGANGAANAAPTTNARSPAIDADLFPGIVKTARFGYDGKGQVPVASRDDVAAALAAMRGTALVLERRIELAAEVSVIVGRTREGAVLAWPVAENRHRNGILDVTVAPARVPDELAATARQRAADVAEALDYVGVLCVEMFLTADGELLVNEIAPRPHNSGHYTIDACVTSQFEQQARILAGLPLGSTRQHTAAVMVNLLGDIWFEGDSATPRDPPWSEVLAHGNAKLHLYGKKEPRRGRKMGHVTCLGDSLADALSTAGAVKSALGIP
jgi:5-(carboxyamino)imidazole ribonucleotide synthase